MIFLVFLVVFPFVGSTSFEKKSMIVKRSEYGDQKVSESGYTFQSNGYGPPKYSSYRLDNGNIQDVPVLGYYDSDQTLRKPIAFQAGSPYTYFDDGSSYSKSYYNHLPAHYQHLYLKPWAPVEYNLPLITNGLYKNPLHPIKYGYAKRHDSTSEDAKNVAEGSKDAAGYKNQHDYDNAAQGKHLEDKNREEYNENGGNKQNKEEQSGYNSESAEAAKGVKGNSFGESNSHKKGSKTTGFHKVYHKDEYKKDHSFYDEKDSSGHYDKYDKNDAKYEKENGKFESGKQAESAHREADFALKKFKDQRKYLDEDNARRKEEGNSASFENSEKFARKGGKQYQDENGYAVSDDK